MELTREQVRELDRRAIEEFGIPGILLMENAGRAVADETTRVAESAGSSRIVIVSGKGNNGGDGCVAARHLANRGLEPSVFVLARFDEISGDAMLNLEIIRRMALDVTEVTSDYGLRRLERAAADAGVLVDALLGTGARGEVCGPIRSAIEIINRAGKPVVAADLPSGLDANTGAVLGVCVKADVTVTFVAAKAGFARGEGPQQTGRVVVAEIGVPRKIVEEMTKTGTSGKP